MNTLLLAMGFYNQPDLYTQFLDVMNLIFTTFFTFEFIIKLSGFGVREYFRDAWNTFDFVIVIGSFLDIVMANLTDGGGASISMLRLFRALRGAFLISDTASFKKQLLFIIIKLYLWSPVVVFFHNKITNLPIDLGEDRRFTLTFLCK